MNKRVYIIVGPESSGNRVTAMLFQEAGIPEVGQGFGVSMDIFKDEKWRDVDNEIMFVRRSIPYGRKFKDGVKSPIEYLDMKEYYHAWIQNNVSPIWIIPFRSFLPLTKSKIKGKRVDGVTMSGFSPEAIVNMQYRRIFRGLIETTIEYFYIINTSLLMVAPERELEGLSRFTEIKFPLDKIKEKLFDADEKWFDKNFFRKE